jgi:hypothetical protein
MVSPGSKIQQFVLHALVPVICSIALGYLFYQEGVFNRYHGSFQFVWSAVVASVFYYLLVFLRSRDAYLGFLVLLMLTYLTTESTRPAFILRDIFYIGAIGASVFVYFHYFRQSAQSNYAYSAVTLAGIYGLVYIVASEIHLGIIRGFGMENTGGDFVGLAATGAFFGVLIGFAVGAGITIARKLFGQIKND